MLLAARNKTNFCTSKARTFVPVKQEHLLNKLGNFVRMHLAARNKMILAARDKMRQIVARWWSSTVVFRFEAVRGLDGWFESMYVACVLFYELL